MIAPAPGTAVCSAVARGVSRGLSTQRGMKRSKIVWNEKTLDRFLASPLTVVPGTAMGYAGVTDSKERSELIAYLKQANESAQCRK